jgi:hypothetical protein
MPIAVVTCHLLGKTPGELPVERRAFQLLSESCASRLGKIELKAKS